MRAVRKEKQMKAPYQEIGVVNTKTFSRRPWRAATPSPRTTSTTWSSFRPIIIGCAESKSPVILQVSKGARDYANQTLLRYMAMARSRWRARWGARSRSHCTWTHGDSFDLCKSCVESGFSSVMIDGSHLPYEENIKLTKQVVDYANQYDVSVEGELGVLAGIEDDVSAEKSHYTDPKQVQDFVGRTGVHSLAISIGTSHGAYKFKLKPGETVPPLRFDILKEIEKKLPGFPIVLHGASSSCKVRGHDQRVRREA